MVLNAVVKKFVSTLIILLFVCSVLAVLPATATDPGTEQNTETMLIKGMVYDASTEKTLGNARVLLWNDRHEFDAVTGEAGLFEFSVPHGPYHIKASAEGYYPAEQLIEKTDHKEVEVKLLLKPMEDRPDPMVVFGHVYDEATSEPIAKAIILFFSDRGEFKTHTMENGAFRIQLPPGFYEVTAEAEGYYESWTEVSGESNDEVEIKILMERISDNEEHWVYVEGIVYIADTDTPISGAWVCFKGENGFAGEAETNDDGWFELELLWGFYHVHAEASGYQDYFTEIELYDVEEYFMEIFAEPLPDDVEPEAGSLKGEVFDAVSHKPVAGAYIEIIKLSPESSIRTMFETKTNDDGQFWFEEVPSGVYHLVVKAEGYEPYESKVEIGFGRFTASENMEFEFDGRATHVKILLKPIHKPEGKPRLSGQVFDAATNKPMKAEVILEPEYTMPCMNVLLVGIRWGQIPCNDSINRLAKWDGFIQVTKGLIIPIKTVAFETGGDYNKGCDDHLYKQTNRLTLEWCSSTIPCWDGLILVIAVPKNAEPASHVTIHTEKWEEVFNFKDLVNIHKIIPVDRMGNEIEIKTKMLPWPDCDERKKPERPSDEKPERPPSDDPDMPPDGPPDRPDERPPPDEEPRTRGGDEDNNELMTFDLGVEEARMKRIHEEIRMHYRERMHRPLITETDEKGYYAFWELPSGHYRMWVRAPCHIEYYNEFTIKPKEHLYVDVYLRPMPKDDHERCYGMVSGQVKHIRSGEPIANAKITFERILVRETDTDPTRPNEDDKEIPDRPERPPLEEERTRSGYEKDGKYYEKDGQRYEKPDCPEHPEKPPEMPAERPPCDEDGNYPPEPRPMVFETTTDEKGFFKIELPCGLYKMTVEARGYEEYVERIRVSDEPSRSLVIELKPAQRTDEMLDSNESTDPSSTDSESGVDAKALGMQVFDDESLNSSILGLVVALMIIGILLPLVLLIRQQRGKTKKPVKAEKVKRKKRIVKKS